MHIWFITTWGPPLSFGCIWRWGYQKLENIDRYLKMTRGPPLSVDYIWWRGYQKGRKYQCLKMTSGEVIKKSREYRRLKMTGGEAIKKYYRYLKTTSGEAIKCQKTLIDAWRWPAVRLSNIDAWGPLPFLSIKCTFGGKAIKSQRISIDAWRWSAARLSNIDVRRQPATKLSKVREYRCLKMTRGPLLSIHYVC